MLAALLQCLLTYKTMAEELSRTCRGNAITWILFWTLEARRLLKIKVWSHFSK